MGSTDELVYRAHEIGDCTFSSVSIFMSSTTSKYVVPSYKVCVEVEVQS